MVAVSLTVRGSPVKRAEQKCGLWCAHSTPQPTRDRASLGRVENHLSESRGLTSAPRQVGERPRKLTAASRGQRGEGESPKGTEYAGQIGLSLVRSFWRAAKAVRKAERAELWETEFEG